MSEMEEANVATEEQPNAIEMGTQSASSIPAEELER